jgi:uncharacterized SAM-dependent methyltransferase
LAIKSNVVLVDLGPGYPTKTIPIVDMLRARTKRLVYCPVDINPHFLSLACTRISKFRDVRVHPFQQLFQYLLRSQLSNVATGRHAQLIVSIGPTFMNFAASEISSILRRLTRTGDLCLVCAQFKSPRITPAALIEPYDTADVERFNFSILKHIGFKSNEVSYFVDFAHHCVNMGFRVLTPSLTMASLGFRRHDTIITAKSHRYTLARYRSVLHAIFKKELELVDRKNSIVVSWCKRGE